jgi:hypothetical protein
MHPFVAAGLINSLSHERIAAAARRADERTTRPARRSRARLSMKRSRTS